MQIQMARQVCELFVVICSGAENYPSLFAAGRRHNHRSKHSTGNGCADRRGSAAIAAGPEHTCVLMLYGGVRCFGANSYGELGNGAMYVDSNPVPSADVLFGAFGICAGYGYSAAILGSGIRLWGRNDYGQLCDGTSTYTSVPPEVDVFSADVYGCTVVAVACGYWLCTRMCVGRLWWRHWRPLLGQK